MTIARRDLINAAEPGWYHCVSRCVRRAFLCGKDKSHRKAWVVERLKWLSRGFAVDVGGYAAMSNHLHVVARIDPQAAAAWSAQEVAERWLGIFPSSYLPDGTPLAPLPVTIAAKAADAVWVAERRKRLSDLGWFMKALKEPIARRANREDGCTGAFWEGRFRSTALLDDAAVLACLVYVDLNPVRANVAATPETSDHTSIQDRIQARQYHAAQMGTTASVSDSAAAPARALFAKLAPDAAPRHAEDGLWLWELGKVRGGRQLLTADDYLRLVDATGRAVRAGKRGSITAETAFILSRLQVNSEAWLETMTQSRQMRGTGVGSSASRAQEAKRRRVGWVANVCALFAEDRAA
jgi:hypothetical protein